MTPVTTPRDPRSEPVAGDVLSDPDYADYRRAMMMWIDGEHLLVARGSLRTGITRLHMEHIIVWRGWAKTAVVVKRGDQP